MTFLDNRHLAGLSKSVRLWMSCSTTCWVLPADSRTSRSDIGGAGRSRTLPTWKVGVTAYSVDCPASPGLSRRQGLKVGFAALGFVCFGGGSLGAYLLRAAESGEASLRTGWKIADELFYSLGITSLVDSAVWIAQHGVHELEVIVKGKKVAYTPLPKIGQAPPGQTVIPAA